MDSQKILNKIVTELKKRTSADFKLDKVCANKELYQLQINSKTVSILIAINKNDVTLLTYTDAKTAKEVINIYLLKKESEDISFYKIKQFCKLFNKITNNLQDEERYILPSFQIIEKVVGALMSMMGEYFDKNLAGFEKVSDQLYVMNIMGKNPGVQIVLNENEDCEIQTLNEDNFVENRVVISKDSRFDEILNITNEFFGNLINFA